MQSFPLNSSKFNVSAMIYQPTWNRREATLAIKFPTPCEGWSNSLPPGQEKASNARGVDVEASILLVHYGYHHWMQPMCMRSVSFHFRQSYQHQPLAICLKSLLTSVRQKHDVWTGPKSFDRQGNCHQLVIRVRLIINSICYWQQLLTTCLALSFKPLRFWQFYFNFISLYLLGF